MSSKHILKQVAVVGGLAAIAGGGYFTIKIQRNISQEEYYKKSMDILRKYKTAVDIFGQPIKSRWLDLGDTEANTLDGINSKLAIPLRGPNEKGTLYMWASRDKPGQSWDIDQLDLEVKSSGKRWTFYKKSSEDNT